MSDKVEITELLYRYAELIDAGDFDGVGRLLARASFGGANTAVGVGRGEHRRPLRHDDPALPR